ncbi:phosphatase PAP2 family protein [Streptomyces sp. TRM49041]|uniref:phosphatase PAP2 family protein n=1 Tax=Streptomyces sp. TRM49041 TaxID=2603216 RepID=UPI0011ED7FB6|nr:phosphatase PAP2 family protein [Streptomyces sp. TRM49041]
MNREQLYKTGWRLAGASAVGGAGVGAVVWLAPGGLGEQDPVAVESGASADGYRAVHDAVAGAPEWLGTLLVVAGEAVLVVLGLLLAWMGWMALRRKDARLTGGAMLVGVGTLVAYGVSEGVKLAVGEMRPCNALRGVAAVAECPGAGDWAFPSNHATLAAGLAVGVALLRPWLAVLTLPLAGAAALLRVAVGVHYPHDVVAGAVLGATGTAAVLVLAWPLATRAISAVLAKLGWHDPGFVGDHGRGRPVVDAEP